MAISPKEYLEVIKALMARIQFSYAESNMVKDNGLAVVTTFIEQFVKQVYSKTLFSCLVFYAQQRKLTLRVFIDSGETMKFGDNRVNKPKANRPSLEHQTNEQIAEFFFWNNLHQELTNSFIGKCSPVPASSVESREPSSCNPKQR